MVLLWDVMEFFGGQIDTYFLEYVGMVPSIDTFRKKKVLVAQLCPTLCNPLDYSPPGSSVYGILQARILE